MWPAAAVFLLISNIVNNLDLDADSDTQLDNDKAFDKVKKPFLLCVAIYSSIAVKLVEQHIVISSIFNVVNIERGSDSDTQLENPRHLIGLVLMFV